jgi:hypothetical protein
MDPWMINYLDEHFRETSRQIEGLREENAQQLASLREELSRRIVALRGEMMRRLEQLDANFRLSRLELEELRNANDVVAEQVSSVAERLGTFSASVTTQLLEMQESGYETRTSVRALEAKVRLLESWAAKAGLDPIENVRQLLERYRSRPPSCVTGSEPQSVTGDG